MWLAATRLGPPLMYAVAHVRSLGAAAPIVFIAVYAGAVIVLVPASALTILAGALFGLAAGFALGFAGAVIGSLCAFLLGRHALRHVVAAQLERMPRLAAVDRAVSAQGRRLVFLLRLSPIVPFNLLNYALALTTISPADFLIASVGMIPATLTYAYLGQVAGDAVEAARTARPPHGASYYGLLAAGLAATVTATILITRAARRALRDV